MPQLAQNLPSLYFRVNFVWIKFAYIFLEKLTKKRKICFEINWPLKFLAMFSITLLRLCSSQSTRKFWMKKFWLKLSIIWKTLLKNPLAELLWMSTFLPKTSRKMMIWFNCFCPCQDQTCPKNLQPEYWSFSTNFLPCMKKILKMKPLKDFAHHCPR